MINAGKFANIATMSIEVNMYICLAALCTIVHAFPSEVSLNLDKKYDEKFDNTITDDETKIEELVSVDTIELYNEITSETRVNKTVNELYPYAVLFSGTCGGTIISSKWIITAAHCTINNPGTKVVAGTDDTANGSGITAKVKRKVIHPLFMVGPYWLNAREYDFKQVSARFDYLLVELEEPLPLNGITMEAAKINKTYELAPGTKVSFAGYGAEFHWGYMQTKMHIRKFEILPEEECASVLGYDSSDMICAKGLSPDPDYACKGDSGSGLVDENGVLIGVTSWVEDDAITCRGGAIVFFAKIDAVLRWIYEVTKVKPQS